MIIDVQRSFKKCFFLNNEPSLMTTNQQLQNWVIFQMGAFDQQHSIEKWSWTDIASASNYSVHVRCFNWDELAPLQIADVGFGACWISQVEFLLLISIISNILMRHLRRKVREPRARWRGRSDRRRQRRRRRRRPLHRRPADRLAGRFGSSSGKKT